MMVLMVKKSGQYHPAGSNLNNSKKPDNDDGSGQEESAVKCTKKKIDKGKCWMEQKTIRHFIFGVSSDRREKGEWCGCKNRIVDREPGKPVNQSVGVGLIKSH